MKLNEYTFCTNSSIWLQHHFSKFPVWLSERRSSIFFRLISEINVVNTWQESYKKFLIHGKKVERLQFLSMQRGQPQNMNNCFQAPASNCVALLTRRFLNELNIILQSRTTIFGSSVKTLLYKGWPMVLTYINCARYCSSKLQNVVRLSAMKTTSVR